MRILLTVNTTWNALNFRKPLIQTLLNLGHDVTVLAPQDAAVLPLRKLGCKVINLSMDQQSKSPLKNVALINEFIRHFASLSPDIILSYTIKNNIFGAFAAKKLGIAFIPNVSGLGSGFLGGTLLRTITQTLYRYAFRHLPIVFFQNPDDQDLFVQSNLIKPEQSRVLPGSGIDLSYFAQTPYPSTEPPVLLMICRVLKDKGVLEYIQAARRLRALGRNVRFQILGPIDVANRTAIRAKDIQRWVDEGLVEYLGEHGDVRPFIAAAHCVVLPSYREGAPRSLIEAASMARPLIATNVAGCKHVVEDHVTGLLCAVKDEQDLARSIEKFLDLPLSARYQMGLSGRKKMCREYDQEIVITNYITAICDLLGTDFIEHEMQPFRDQHPTVATYGS